MTIGISKERLLKKLVYVPIGISDYDRGRNAVLNELLIECTEPNQWSQIETAPLNKKLRLVHGGQLGTGQTDAILYQESDKQYFTHYQELPGDPQ